MPKSKRKKVFTKAQARAQREKMIRRNETSEKREKRLALKRENARRWREIQNETQPENYKENERRRKRIRELKNEQKKRKMNILRRNRRDEMKMCLENEAFHYNSAKEYDKHPNIIIGKMDVTCIFCGAKKFKGETQSMCCKNGKIILPPLEKPPTELFT